jgi:hypothetical protein
MSRATLKKTIYEITPPCLLKLGKRVLTGAPLPKIRSETGQLFLKYAREFSFQFTKKTGGLSKFRRG